MAASPLPAPEQPQPVRGMQCSDCRNVSRTSYYALNERPVCVRCKQQYAERIARAKAPGAWGRTVIQGFNAAAVGALVTALGGLHRRCKSTGSRGQRGGQRSEQAECELDRSVGGDG